MNSKYEKAIEDVAQYFKESGMNFAPVDFKSTRNAKNFAGIFSLQIKDTEIYFRVKTNWIFPIHETRESLIQNIGKNATFFIITENEENFKKWKIVPVGTIINCLEWCNRLEKKNKGSIHVMETNYGRSKFLSNIKNVLTLPELKKILTKKVLTDSIFDLKKYFPLSAENQKRSEDDRMVKSSYGYITAKEYFNRHDNPEAENGSINFSQIYKN